MDNETNDEDIDGSIQTVHVKNFFCHENLEINFNRNVNFVVGRNGSGKSAILTALVVGLGGRASATNRGNNLHSFIRKGANSATVEIKIKNTSAKAYKHDVYGDSITVVRNINASGGSSYKVKSASGEVISTKFNEVAAIITAHDIQVDNPISVLNQDDARSFHASDAKKKYSLFRKATNLDQTEINYMRAIENCNKASGIWQRKKEASLELEKEYKKWETSYEQLQSRDEIEQHKQQLQNEYYWSEIVELENDAESVQIQYNRQNERINKLMEKLNSMEQKFGNNSETLDALKAQLEEKLLSKTALQQELQQLETEVREVQAKWRQAQAGTSKCQDTLKREKKKLEALEQEINSIESGSSASRRGELERAVSRAQAEVSAVSARYSTADHEVQQAQQNASHAARQQEQLAADVANAASRARQLKQQLRELESRGNDSLAVYGNNMAELCQRVKQATAKGIFSAPPKGPVGSYLKVKEKKWAGALEHIIGGSLQSFCVNSAEDSRKLFEIMGEVYGKSSKPAVTCSKFLNKVHDVGPQRVRTRDYKCALDALDVADPVVANFLIDNIGVERILLVPDHEEAIRLSDNVENVPENCSKIVTLDSTEYHPAPNYRSYGGANKPSRYLSLSTGERKKQVIAEISEVEAQLKELQQSLSEAECEAKKASELSRNAAAKLKSIMTLRSEKEALARAANNALQQHHAPHHNVLIEEQEVCQRKLESLSGEMEQLAQQESGFRRRVDEYDVTMKKAKEKLHQVKAECRTISEEIDQEQLKMEQGVTERQMCAQKLKEDKVKIVTVKQILDEKREVIANKTKEALELCQRIDKPRDTSTITRELKKTVMKLQSLRSDGLTKAQVAEKLLAAQRKYTRAHDMLGKLKSLIAEIEKTSEQHLKFCHQVQTYVARRAQHSFQAVLALRGYCGRMDIDNSRGTLEILCTGRESADRRVASSTSSLSGGERSYSTVAFIMSLWDCVELPFYFMDEFDVFMDNVNRKIVMELLIDHALKNTSRQFVFLTPQDASTVVAGPQIKIHRMADPRS